jgi:hypothetical protein
MSAVTTGLTSLLWCVYVNCGAMWQSLLAGKKLGKHSGHWYNKERDFWWDVRTPLHKELELWLTSSPNPALA